MPIEQIAWDKQDYVTCDDRGRATLGTEFANEGVFVHIARPPDISHGEEIEEERLEVLSKMATWASKNLTDVEWFDLRPEEGVVVDKHGKEYDSPYSYDPS